MPRASKSQKEAKRQIVARGIAAGKSTKKIAAEAGCGPRHVQRLASEIDTQVLIVEMLRPHRRKLAAAVKKALDAIDRGLGAKKKTPHDHLAQLRAVERLGDMLKLAQGDPKQGGEKDPGQVTWEEFVVMWRKRQGGEECQS
jgi:hypothetical protein